MAARYGLAVLTIFGLTVACSESKLRAGHCEHDTDCPSGQVCVLEGTATFTCAASDGGLPDGDASEVAPECTTSSQCPAEKPICDAQTCRACDGAHSGDGAACASRDSGRPVCGPSGACVECVSPTSADCTANPAKPICDPTSNTCMGCATDDQCLAKGVGPGLCMSHQDGRCASDSEVIYVENKGGCASSALTPMAGSSGSPFCGPQFALDSLTTSRRVLVISGAVMGASWTPAKWRHPHYVRRSVSGGNRTWNRGRDSHLWRSGALCSGFGRSEQRAGRHHRGRRRNPPTGTCHCRQQPRRWHPRRQQRVRREDLHNHGQWPGPICGRRCLGRDPISKRLALRPRWRR